MSAGFLEVEGLVVRYGPVIAVDGIGFRVERGEHLTLLGPSGCGKTTTLRAIAGLEAPSAGRIVIDGMPVCDVVAGQNVPPERRGLSMVFQSYAIWPHMTVFENVAFGFRVRGIARGKARPAVERALALVDLAGLADRPATRLSGGQQQRVALARAIAYDTKIVLLDEPLSNLDAQLRLQMRTELRDLRRRLGFTAIYVTHDQEEAFALSDRIIVMRGGRIEQQGTPSEIHRAPCTRSAVYAVRRRVPRHEEHPRCRGVAARQPSRHGRGARGAGRRFACARSMAKRRRLERCRDRIPARRRLCGDG
jgi:iron(III) transport system ATP-binding protein